MKIINLLILFIVLSISIFAQTNENKIALVIGNSAYTTNGALKNPVNDAELMSQTLKELGFTVVKKINATKPQMDAAILDFWRKLPDYKVALFYYAGHGIQIEGVNYLVPIGAKMEDPLSADIEAIDVNKIVNKFESYSENTNIIILDACRNNPYRTWKRGGNRGFVQIKSQPSGTIIAFATREEETAADGDGKNGLFTANLVKNIKSQKAITDIFMDTRADVLKASNNKQCPQEWNMLTTQFFFFKPSNLNQNLANEKNIVQEKYNGIIPKEDMFLLAIWFLKAKMTKDRADVYKLMKYFEISFFDEPDTETQLLLLIKKYNLDFIIELQKIYLLNNITDTILPKENVRIEYTLTKMQEVTSDQQVKNIKFVLNGDERKFLADLSRKGISFNNKQSQIFWGF